MAKYDMMMMNNIDNTSLNKYLSYHVITLLLSHVILSEV